MDYSETVVKVLSQNIYLDWRMPFRISKPGKSIGSGFFIDNKGLILTCSHIIDSGIKVFVEIPKEGFEKFGTEILGICPKMDLALLRIVGYKPKKYLKFGDIKKIKMGDDVIAVGFPLGQEYIKITKGVISGYQYGLFQTDTTINPGNSGGPLIWRNMVIGINSSIIKTAQNVGFAIPISYYRVIEDRLRSGEIFVKRPKLGVEYNNVNKDLLNFMDSECVKGVYVGTIYEESPILKSGLREGDILCSINGKKVDNYGLIDYNSHKITIFDYTQLIKMDDNVRISYWHQLNKKMENKKFKFSYFDLPIRMKYPIYENIDYQIFAGFIFMDLSLNHIPFYKYLRHYFQNEYRIKPLIIITKVLPGSTVANMDVIGDGNFVAKINGIRVDTVMRLQKALLKPLEKKGKYVFKIETNLNIKVIMDLKMILGEEKVLAEKYMFPLNNVIKKLMVKIK